MATNDALRRGGSRASVLTALTAAIALIAPGAAAAPPIRTTDLNQVPACVTPGRLMAFLAERNGRLAPRFRDIAYWYKYFGEGWRVRWDYAFFQMAVETNFLTFRRGDGQPGDVRETQNNFAGIGATGNGAHGESFADIPTGVHAQIQHLVAYSGERLAEPIAARTRDKQGDIVEASLRLGRPVTFADLARRWAVDRAYGKSIDFVADLYWRRFCSDPPARSAQELAPPAPMPARREGQLSFRPPSGLGGPKPQKLAGPEPEAEAEAGGEELPWLAAPAKKPSPAEKLTKPTKRPASTPEARVKTIWSRGEGQQKKAPPQPEPRKSDDSWASVTVVRRGSEERGAGGTFHLDGSPALEPGQHHAAADDTDPLPPLPTFRIAPLGAEPSRLGGPLPLAPPTNAATLVPEMPPLPCRVLTASYGGKKTLLIRAKVGRELQLTALTIIDGFEKSMFDAYARTEAPGAEIIGEYPDPAGALADARVNCPDG